MAEIKNEDKWYELFEAYRSSEYDSPVFDKKSKVMYVTDEQIEHYEEFSKDVLSGKIPSDDFVVFQWYNHSIYDLTTLDEFKGVVTKEAYPNIWGLSELWGFVDVKPNQYKTTITEIKQSLELLKNHVNSFCVRGGEELVTDSNQFDFIFRGKEYSSIFVSVKGGVSREVVDKIQNIYTEKTNATKGQLICEKWVIGYVAPSQEIFWRKTLILKIAADVFDVSMNFGIEKVQYTPKYKKTKDKENGNTKK